MGWLKRYLVFAGPYVNNPKGGWDDFHGSFDTIEDARVAASKAMRREITARDDASARALEEQGFWPESALHDDRNPRWFEIIDTEDEHYREASRIK